MTIARAFLISSRVIAMIDRAIIIFALVIFALLAVAILAHASAHDFWINNRGYTSPIDGVHCCGISDCPMIPASDVHATKDGWLIVSTGELIPYAVTYASEDGNFYRCHPGELATLPMTPKSMRCFFAPSGSS